MSAKPDLRIVLCSPRGFCAGVVRAIDTVERALAIYGAPVYVRHEIVHNKYVVDSLKTKGAIFVEELEEIPDNTNAPVVFSAHGVPKSVPAEAKQRNFFSLDATCPLVTKVHREAAIHFKRGREILLIGHSHHPEVVGTLGQLPAGAISLIETAEDAKTITPKDPNNLAFVTQTTLSIDDTKEIVEILKRRFPNISGPHKEDICYATTNRQLAVKKVAPVVDALIVVGAPNSSNSQRLREVAAGQMHSGQRLAHPGAMRRVGPARPHAFEEIDDRRGAPGQRRIDRAAPVLRRLRAAHAMFGQMRHQRQKVRQVALRHSLLIEREDVGSLRGVHQEVGIFDTLGDALVGEQFADIVTPKEFRELFGGDVGVDRHGLPLCSVRPHRSRKREEFVLLRGRDRLHM